MHKIEFDDRSFKEIQKLSSTCQKKWLGSRIRYFRIQRNISQADVANRASVNQANVSHWEAGTTTMSVITLFSIADLLDMPMEELLNLGSIKSKISKLHDIDVMKELEKENPSMEPKMLLQLGILQALNNLGEILKEEVFDL